MATMTAPVTDTKRIPGGSFLITDPAPADCFFPEDFTDEQQADRRDHGELCHQRDHAGLGPDRGEGLLLSRGACSRRPQTLASPRSIFPRSTAAWRWTRSPPPSLRRTSPSRRASRSAFSAHVGIGTLPLVWYGTPSRRRSICRRSPPARSSRAYALSESTSGSDAVNARTTAVLSADGKTYTLNGEKMWITNAGFADLFTVFAKCAIPDGPDAGKEKLTAFLIERGTPGFTDGQGGAQARHSRQLHLSADSHRLRDSCGESARRGRQGASHCVQHSERRPLQAWQRGCRRRPHGARTTASAMRTTARRSANRSRSLG